MTKVWRIVVGVDESSTSVEALRWAADEARLRGGELTVVHVWLPPDTLHPAPYAPAHAADPALGLGLVPFPLR